MKAVYVVFAGALIVLWILLSAVAGKLQGG